MKCLLLGAGYATRLYPLTKDRPKPLLPIAGVPILERILDKALEVPAVDAVYVVSNHRFVENYREWVKDLEARRRPRAPITVFDDGSLTNDDRLGAIGDIDFVIRQAGVDDDLLIVAGDNLFDFRLDGLARTFAERGTTIALMDLAGRPPELISRYSVVDRDAAGRVTRFEEKPPRPRTTLVSIGLYLYARKDVPMIRRYLEAGEKPDAPGYLVQWLHTRVPVHGCVLEGSWFDIGDIQSYETADRLYRERNRG